MNEKQRLRCLKEGDKSLKLYITGGGTGGHVTPGLAIARMFRDKHAGTVVRFGGTDGGIETRLVPREGYQIDTLPTVGLSRSLSPKGLIHNVRASALALQAVRNAKKTLTSFAPDCVIGCGGYASFAFTKAAQQLGIPTVLLEVNALPGKVTKMLSSQADRVLVCFPEAKQQLGENDSKVVLTGAPVRGEIIVADRKKARAALSLSEEDQLVVSFWGSMGAKYMNEHMAKTMALEMQRNVSYHHIHASGGAAKDWMPRLLEEQGAPPYGNAKITLVEYIYNMDAYLAAADLVLCRAGAATLGEICMLGRPGILVPSPFVAENHQEKNARALEKVGGCRVLLEKDANAERLLSEISDMLSDREALRAMGKNAAKLAPNHANETIYKEIMEVVCAPKGRGNR